MKHVRYQAKKGRERRSLYRVLYYDCPPFDNKSVNPVTGKTVKFAETDLGVFKAQFLNELKRLRKVALRLGHYGENPEWLIQSYYTKPLINGELEPSELAEKDVFYDLRQKSVDMKIGLDIASLSYKRLVDQIILIAGDTDFVPAAKLARREGIDFILDPMWNHINPNLYEHIDGLHTVWKKPALRPR